MNRKAGARCHHLGVALTIDRTLTCWLRGAAALFSAVLCIGGLILTQAAMADASLAAALSGPVVTPFRSVTTVPATNALLCPTARVCYAAETSGVFTGSGFVRTADGGATWKPTGALPVNAFLTNPSCPTAQVCVGGAIELGSNLGPKGTLEMVETTDGGAHWRLDTLSVPSDFSYAELNELSCPSATFCLALVSGDLNSGALTQGLLRKGGVFMMTRNGGRSWQPVGAPIDLTLGYATALRCEADGQCLSLVQTFNGSNPSSVLNVRHSSDFGGHWTFDTTALPGGANPMVSCSDATHCVVVESRYNHGPLDLAPGKRADIARTSNGGRTWVTQDAPASWPNDPVALSCATPHDCFVSASTVGTGGQSGAVLEVTHDGGANWHPIMLPRFHGDGYVTVDPLSCPVSSGCIGLGTTKAQTVPGLTFNQREVVSNLPR
jgi:hypothetical protein